MDLHKLRVFHTAARAGSFTRASEELHLSQSTISQHIQQLESELGCALFVRVGRRVVLNATGQVLLQHSERIFNGIRNAESAVREMQSLQGGCVRVGAVTTILVYRLPEVLSAFKKAYPKIEVTVVSGSSESVLHNVRIEKVDLGIVMLPVPQGGLLVRPLCREEMVIALHPNDPLARKPAITASELASCPLILYEKDTTIQRMVDRYFANMRMVPRITMVTAPGNVEAIKSLVRAGLGASILPVCAIDPKKDSGLIHIARVKGYPAYRELGLATIDAEVLSPAANVMAQMIIDALGDS